MSEKVHTIAFGHDQFLEVVHKKCFLADLVFSERFIYESNKVRIYGAVLLFSERFIYESNKVQLSLLKRFVAISYVSVIPLLVSGNGMHKKLQR